MSMIKALRTLAAIENGTLNAAQLEAQVAGSQARKDEISQLLSVKSLYERISMSKTAMAALVGSTTTWAEILGHKNAATFLQTYVVQSANAMSALCAAPTAFNALIASGHGSGFFTVAAESVPAKMAFYNSDTALNSIKASAYIMAILRSASRYAVTGAAVASGVVSVSLSTQLTGANYIILGASQTSTTAYNYILATLRSGTAISGTVSTGVSANTHGKDTDVAIPLAAAFSFTSQAGNTSASYFGALRCDI